MSELAQRDPVSVVVSQVRSPVFREQIVDALPESVTPDKFIRVAITAIRENPDLANADPNSLFASIVKCAQDGLYPDGREAALVLYKGKVGYLPMIGGFRKIAAEYGWALRTKAVYANDEFDYTEEPPTLTHRPVRPGADRGELIAAYAIATHRDGRRLQTVLHPEDIAARRAMAQTQKVWDAWTAAMYEKTAGRDLFKDLPLDSKDRERIERMFTADLEPGDAAALLYGPQARAALTQVPPPTAEGGDVVDVAPEHDDGPVESAEAGPGTDTDDSQQAGTAAIPPAAAPVPGDDEPEPSLDADPAFGMPPGEAEELARQAAAAGETIFANGKAKGLTIRQVADRGDEGANYLLYVLRRWAHDSLHTAVSTYTRIMLPDVWATYQAWLSEQGGES